MSKQISLQNGQLCAAEDYFAFKTGRKQNVAGF